MRGSPHLHSLCWIKDGPNLDTPEGIKEAQSSLTNISVQKYQLKMS